MYINLEYDAKAQAAPQSFRDAIQAAANVLQATFTDAVTINVEVGYGENPGNGKAEPSGGASAGPAAGVLVSYTQVRTWLAQNAAAAVQSGVTALPTTSSIQSQSQVAVWHAQERLLGQVSPNDTSLDGYAGFATDISASALQGVALHELTHAMGRVSYGPQPDILDLFRFTKQGTWLFADTLPASASYFSLNGGVTDLADFGRTSDDSDFLNSSGRTPNDPFNEFYNASTIQGLTSVDLLEMESLGFHPAGAPTPGSISINNVSVTEGNSGTQTATFTVTRSGGTAAFSVNYATADGTATVADNDYVARSGTLTFAAGVNTQTISVTVNGDTRVEPNETFFVNLSGATNGATIASSTGTGTIVNDDVVARSSLFGTIVTSQTSPGGEIYDLYDGLLGRAPDPLGLESWTASLQAGTSPHDLAHAFLGSAEFTARNGNYAQLSNSAFVEALYETTLRRTADPQGLQGWADSLSHGLSRDDLAVDFAFSAEHQQILQSTFDAGVFVPNATDASVARLYYGLLGRAPDAAGLAAWENAVASGMSLQTLAQTFITSTEYQAAHGQQTDHQFVQALYQGALGQAEDASGAAWETQLSQGASRASVAIGIVEGPQAQVHLAANVEIGMQLTG